MQKTMRIVAAGLRFPEGPVAMRDGSVLVTEVAGGTISRIGPDGAVSVVADVGGGPNGLAVGPDGKLYVCNNGGLLWQPEQDGILRSRHGVPPGYRSGSIQRVDPDSGDVELLYDSCNGHALCGPNDLVFDRHGGFYFTDFGKVRERSRDTGSVYYALPDGSAIRELIHPIMNPNGIGLSPDQRTLYVAETETCRLWAYPVLGPGELDMAPYPSPNGGRLVCGLGGYQRFDSLAVDAEGNICVATLVSGMITVISPSGEMLRQVAMPDAHTTNLCFATAAGKATTIYVTQSHMGQLLEMTWPNAGLPLNSEA